MTGSGRGMYYFRRNQDFIKSVMLLSSGSFLSQLLPVLVSPLLTRVYQTEDFGTYALFMAALNIAGQVVCLKYDMAITIVRDQEEAVSLFYLCVTITSSISALFMLALPFAPSIAGLVGALDDRWIYLLPIAAFLVGSNMALTSYSIRMERYGEISCAAVLRAVVMAVSQLLLAPLGLGGFSLALGQILSYLAGNIRLLGAVLPALKKQRPRSNCVFATAVKYSAYPGYTTVGSVANSMIYNASSFLLSSFYTPALLGCYSLINRVLGTPLTILSSSVGQVFTRKLSIRQMGDHTARIYLGVSAVLTAMAIPTFLLVGALGAPLIPFIFGEAWGPSVGMLRAVLPLFAVRFVVSPVSTSAIIAGKQGMTMVWQIMMLIASWIPAALMMALRLSMTAYLTILSAVLCVGYLIFYCYCLIILQRSDRDAADKKSL